MIGSIYKIYIDQSSNNKKKLKSLILERFFLENSDKSSQKFNEQILVLNITMIYRSTLTTFLHNQYLSQTPDHYTNSTWLSYHWPMEKNCWSSTALFQNFPKQSVAQQFSSWLSWQGSTFVVRSQRNRSFGTRKPHTDVRFGLYTETRRAFPLVCLISSLSGFWAGRFELSP